MWRLLFSASHAYTVHEPPNAATDRADRAEAMRFVREGFSLFAALLPPLWMIANRLWLVLFGYIVLTLFVSAVLTVLKVPLHWHGYVMLAISIIIGFEADSLIRWTLLRQNWHMVGGVSGTSFEECERRFFEGWTQAVPVVSPANMDPPGARFSPTADQQPKDGELMPPKRRWRPWSA